MGNAFNFRNETSDIIQRTVRNLGGYAFAEIWVGESNHPAYSLVAEKTELINDNLIRIYTIDGDIFETSSKNVVLRICKNKQTDGGNYEQS